MVSERRFGIEIECGHRWEAEEVAEHLNRELGTEIDGDYDGSGCELRVGPYQGVQGFETVRRIMDEIRHTGGYVTRADGMHIHLEAKDYIGNEAMQARLVRSWTNLEPAIEKIVAPYRRSGPGQCPKIWKKGDGKVSVLKQRGETYWSRGNLNLNNVTRRPKMDESFDSRFITKVASDWQGHEEEYECCKFCGEDRDWCECAAIPPTVEIRWHEGNLDPEVAIAWIQMGQALLDKVATEGMTIRACARPDVLVRRLELDGDTGVVLVNKARTVKDPSAYDRYDSGSY